LEVASRINELLSLFLRELAQDELVLGPFRVVGPLAQMRDRGDMILHVAKSFLKLFHDRIALVT
jgi:hypothetical protein